MLFDAGFEVVEGDSEVVDTKDVDVRFADIELEEADSSGKGITLRFIQCQYFQFLKSYLKLNRDSLEGINT